MSRQQLDARRMLCPMPVIKTQNQVAAMQAGDEVEVICTDPGALNDIPAWARINGHSVIDTVQDEDEIRITVRVGA
ncbi:MAG: sulfurtransferase TusA family protein [Pseudomonadota bacterium]|jgi:tRNA 2-thiouridine synthesizing protein A|nr:sulfurtransferase TusA family protein [Pseudomonadota bacterium]